MELRRIIYSAQHHTPSTIPILSSWKVVLNSLVVEFDLVVWLIASLFLLLIHLPSTLNPCPPPYVGVASFQSGLSGCRGALGRVEEVDLRRIFGSEPHPLHYTYTQFLEAR